jgi:hypothetical protein
MSSTTIQTFSEHPNHNMGEWVDSTRFYNLKTLKKKYGFHTRSPVAVLTTRYFNDSDYVSATINVDNKQKVPTCCPAGCERAEIMDMSMFVNGDTCSPIYQSWYPYGDVIIKGETIEQYEEKQKKKKYMERCNAIKKELIKKIKEDTDEKRLAMIMNLIENFDKDFL